MIYNSGILYSYYIQTERSLSNNTLLVQIHNGKIKCFILFLKVEEADVLLILHQKPELALEKLNQLPSGRFAGKHSTRE